jgi:serine protease AprX
MNVNVCAPVTRRKAVWGPKATLAVAAMVFLALGSDAFAAGEHSRQTNHSRPGKPNSNATGYKLDKELTKRIQTNGQTTTRVIVEWQPGSELPAAFRRYAKQNGNLRILNGTVLDLPNGLLRNLSNHPSALRIHYDRPTFKADYTTGMTVGSRAVQAGLGFTGAGVGVAVIDSGVATWHDDLTNRSSLQYPYGDQRVSAFVDFVNSQTTPYDDDGHGTHVAGMIAGNGYDSNGQKAGIAPDASLVILKVLDQNGNGTISNLIQALNWVLDNHVQYNIRVVNMSVAAGVHESYWTDPLTLAAKRLADAGVVVVAAAGNAGKNAQGQPQYGGVGAPGNAPWVLTVGASSTNGTVTRADDTMADFSSRGPTYLDWSAKPDLVAPGVGSVSLAAPSSTFYQTKPNLLLTGSISTASMPYLSLSGTSMAAPVVSGTVALMLQANPTLTPNAVKAILQYTAQTYQGYDALTQGAGFLNTLGAVRLALFYAHAQPGQVIPDQSIWSRHIIWGNHMLTGGLPVPSTNAFALTTTWGVSKTDANDNIVWGTACADVSCDNIVWGTSDGNDNIVWGTSGGADNIVWGTANGDDNIVWGTDCGGDDCDNIVWGTADDTDNIVWGTASDQDNIVWGTASDPDNIVWGTSDADDNIVWGTADGNDNIVWGTSGGDDNIVWGTSAGDDNIVWGTSTGDDNIVWGTDASGQPTLMDTVLNVPISWGSLSQLMSNYSDKRVFSITEKLANPPASAPAPPPPTPGDPGAPPPPAPGDPVTDPSLAPPAPPAPGAPATDPSLAPPAPPAPGAPATDPSLAPPAPPSVAPPPPPVVPQVAGTVGSF